MSTKTNVLVTGAIQSTTVVSPVRSDVGDNMETREAASLTIEEILQKLDTSFHNGLTSVEVERRRHLHREFNEMNIKEHEPMWRKYLEQVCHISLYIVSLYS